MNPQQQKSPILKIVIAGLTIFAVGAVIGFLIAGRGKQTSVATTTNYQYLSPRVETTEGNYAISKVGYDPFREKLIAFIDSEKQAGKISDVSIFFRDLDAGPTFGINELTDFSPASLLKFPTAIAYMNLSENHPDLLKTALKYTQATSTTEQFFKPSVSIEPNRFYTIEELIINMLAYSDNLSYGVLHEYLRDVPDGPAMLVQTFKDLGVSTSENPADENLNTKGYASIFRMLYDASYLNAESSEKMLSWLALSDFKDGLVAGVPASIKIAHKFGERAFVNIELKQLHDCGIIYYPNNPYLLCVMTKGNDWNDLESTIQDISKQVYQEVDSRRLIT